MGDKWLRVGVEGLRWGLGLCLCSLFTGKFSDWLEGAQGSGPIIWGHTSDAKAFCFALMRHSVKLAASRAETRCHTRAYRARSRRVSYSTSETCAWGAMRMT